MLRLPFARVRCSPPQCLQGEERLPYLTPKRRLIPAEPLEHAVIEIGKAQEAPRHIKLNVAGRQRVVTLAAAFVGLAGGRLAAWK